MIDEPQIIEKEVWNLFLRAPAIACREQACQALLLTATLPPTETGLGFAPVELVRREEIEQLPTNRYVVNLAIGQWDAARTAKRLIGVSTPAAA